MYWIFPYLCIRNELFDSIAPQNAENRTVANSLLLFLKCSVKCLFLKWLCQTVENLKYTFSPWVLSLLLLTGIGNIQELHAMNKMPFPPAYQNFFRLGLVLKEHVSPETVVASRKGELLYMFSGTRVAGYAYSQDDRAVIQKMLDDGVEYVILDQLGYSSTPRYLYPAIQKNDDLFFVASHVPNPDTYLLKFDREAAKKKLSQSQRQDGKNTLP